MDSPVLDDVIIDNHNDNDNTDDSDNNIVLRFTRQINGCLAPVHATRGGQANGKNQVFLKNHLTLIMDV